MTIPAKSWSGATGEGRRIRVALYLRTSGSEQEEQQTSKTQLHYLREYCERNGMEVVGVYADEGCESHIPIAEREDGHRLLEDAKAGKFDEVLVFRSCRWSRYPDVYHAGRRALLKASVGLQSISEALNFDTPGNSFGSDIILRSNQLFREVINDNFTRGRYRRAAEPSAYPGGVVPLGFRVVDDDTSGKGRKRLEIDEVEADLVRRIFRLLVEEGWSTLRISQTLNDEGVPIASDNQANGYRPPHPGARWHHSTITKIIRAPIYAGCRTWGGTYTSGVENRVPAIIDRDLWERAQDVLSGNFSKSKRSAKRVFLLKGKVRCLTCGRAYTGFTPNRNRILKKGGEPAAFYRCNGYHDRNREQPQRRACPLPHLSAAKWEAEAWEHVVAHISDAGGTLAKLQAKWSTEEDHGRALLRERDVAMRQKASLDAEEEAALRGVNRLGIELTPDQCRRLLDRVAADQQRNRSLREAIDKRLKAAGSRAEQLRAAAANLTRWQDRLTRPLTDEDRAFLVDTFLDRAEVTVDEEGPLVTFYLVFDPDPMAGRAEQPDCPTNDSEAKKQASQSDQRDCLTNCNGAKKQANQPDLRDCPTNHIPPP